jgi:hypothetical protein
VKGRVWKRGEGWRERENEEERGRPGSTVCFPPNSIPSQTFSSPGKGSGGTYPPLQAVQILSKDVNRRFPSTERPEITLYSPSLFQLIKIAALGLPILAAHHQPWEGVKRLSGLTPFETPCSPEPRSCLPNLFFPGRPMLQWQEPAASLPASNCQALPEPTSRPGLIYKYANLPLFWYANRDMTNS